MKTASQQISIGLLSDLHFDGDAGTFSWFCSAIAGLNSRSPDFSVFLGDCVVADNACQALKLLQKTASVFQRLECPIFYLSGNHDLDFLTKDQFFRAIGKPGENAVRMFVKNGITCIFLDANYSADGIEYRCGNFDWTNAFIPFTQLCWLEARLKETVGPVVVFSHQRIDPSPRHSIINAAEVRNILEQSGKVCAVFQGHDHTGDRREIGGITYYTLPALREGSVPMVAEISVSATREEKEENGTAVGCCRVEPLPQAGSRRSGRWCKCF